MKNFFASLLGTFVGIILSFIVLFFIFAAIIAGIASSGKEPEATQPNTILYIKLDKQIIDRQPESAFNIAALRDEAQIGLNQILASIKHAKTDSDIKGIYLETGIMSAGLASCGEIREALKDFQSSGKFVVAYSDVYLQSAYYLSSVSDKVFFNPAGFFTFNGLKIQTTYVKNALEKLNIEPTVVKIGKYKGAGELFEYDKMSESNREQLDRLVNKFWENILGEISISRKISADSLNYLVENLLIRNPKDVLAHHLVDSLVYKGQVINYLKKITSTPEKEDLKIITPSKYYKIASRDWQKGSDKNKIAIIYASGDIMMGEGDDNNIGGERFAREVRMARRDSSIKAIVIRVNSPGGSALASEEFLQEILNTKGVKPIVVSMGDVAASGGYYISCAADTILSSAYTITGSIGVISVFFNAKGFFDKMGITFDIAKSNQYADFMTGRRAPTDAEKEYWQQFTEYTYNMFLNRVSEGRKIDYNEVNNIAQGHVWGGDDAITHKLVDAHGGLYDAIEVARKMAKLSDYSVVELPKLEDPITKIIKDLSGDAKFDNAFGAFGIDKATFCSIKSMMLNQGTVARLEYFIDIQ
jgi:protease IV